MIGIAEIGLGLILAASAHADLRTTQICRTRPYCVESNPIVRKLGTPFVVGSSAGTWYVSHLFKREGHRGWWIPVVATIGIHSFAAIHNQRLAREAK